MRSFTILWFAAHLNHFLEIYAKQNYRIVKAAMVIGMVNVYVVHYQCHTGKVAVSFIENFRFWGISTIST